MIGTIMGIGGAAMGAINANSASKQSWENQVKLMDIQAGLNRQNAKFNNQMAKDMWHYTNFSNQMKEIKKAGLSPGLIYGMGGQGGSTAGAGQASGVGLPQDQSVGMGLRAQEIGLQLANTMSQIKLNESQAGKNEAEANKITGVDTEAQKATINNLIAQTGNEKIKRGLILGQIRVNDAEEELKRAGIDYTKGKTSEIEWNIKSLQKGIEKLGEEINGLELDNELKEKTMDNKVKESALVLEDLLQGILVKGSQRKVNEEQAKAIVEQVKQGWEDLIKKGKGLIIQKEQTEAYVQDVINRLELGKKGLDIEEQKIIKDVILGLVNIAAQGAGQALGAKVGKTGFQ